MFARWERRCHARVFEGFGMTRSGQCEERIRKTVERFWSEGRKPKRREVQQRIGGSVYSAQEFNRAFDALLRLGEFDVEQESGCIVRTR
jgi:hypothetical protein